jgi:hypothetical protein
MSVKKRTREELIEMAEHIHYEIWMLNHTCYILSSGYFLASAAHNTILESFAIHVRNLIDFLYEKKANVKGDAIVAEHYFPNPQEWIEIRPIKSNMLKNAKKLAEKQVAHLTYTRKNKEPWAYIEITKEIKLVFKIFFNNILKDLFGKYYNATISEINKCVNHPVI